MTGTRSTNPGPNMVAWQSDHIPPDWEHTRAQCTITIFSWLGQFTWLGKRMMILDMAHILCWFHCTNMDPATRGFILMGHFRFLETYSRYSSFIYGFLIIAGFITFLVSPLVVQSVNLFPDFMDLHVESLNSTGSRSDGCNMLPCSAI